MLKKSLIILGCCMMAFYVFGQKGSSANAITLQTSIGEDVYKQNCISCHDKGIGGAPIIGDKKAWASRLEQGMDTLVQHSIEGYKGEAGEMPAKGGNSELPDDQVKEAVAFIIAASK